MGVSKTIKRPTRILDELNHQKVWDYHNIHPKLEIHMVF